MKTLRLILLRKIILLKLYEEKYPWKCKDVGVGQETGKNEYCQAPVQVQTKWPNARDNATKFQ